MPDPIDKIYDTDLRYCRQMLYRIVEQLWLNNCGEWDLDKEWDADTTSRIADILEDFRPEEREDGQVE